MKLNNDIIEKIRKARHDFADAHGNDLEKMAQAVSVMVDHTRFNVVCPFGDPVQPTPVGPNLV